jgi:hypothetical protein
MNSERSGNRHPGINISQIPVAGVGGIIFAAGILVLAVVGLPIAKWFLLGAGILGLVVVGGLQLFRKAHPRTEIEEFVESMAAMKANDQGQATNDQFNVGRQLRRP